MNGHKHWFVGGLYALSETELPDDQQVRERTMMRKKLLSLIVAQQPTNATMNTTQPSTMTKIAKLAMSHLDNESGMMNRHNAPATMIPTPRSYNSRTHQFQQQNTL